MIVFRTKGGHLDEIRNSEGKTLLVFNENISALDDLDLTGAVLDDTAIDGLMALSTIFDRASMKNCDFYWLIAHEASFRGADLSNCKFSGSGLRDTDFRGALMRGTKFCTHNLGRRTDLSGADLSTAILDMTDFGGASYSVHTKFPSNFDPKAHGLVPSD